MSEPESIDAWIEEQRARLRAVRDEADADLAALERVAELRKRSPQRQARQELSTDPEALAGLSVLEAAIRIAKDHDGMLVSTPARELMVKAGVLDDTRASSTVLYAALNESGRFEKSGKRGEYALVEEHEDDGHEEDEVDETLVPSRYTPPHFSSNGITTLRDRMAQ